MQVGLLLIVSALMVVFALAAYALYLFFQLRKRERQRQEWRAEVEQVVQERADNIRGSLSVIAAATLEGQVGLSEGCLRLSSLLNQLGPVATEDRFQVIHKVAEDLAHIPILDEWKKLKFQQRMVHMKEMETIEEKYRDFALECCRNIKMNGVDSIQDIGYFTPVK